MITFRRAQHDVSLFRCAHLRDIELNTRREISCLHAPTDLHVLFSVSLVKMFVPVLCVGAPRLFEAN